MFDFGLPIFDWERRGRGNPIADFKW